MVSYRSFRTYPWLWVGGWLVLLGILIQWKANPNPIPKQDPSYWEGKLDKIRGQIQNGISDESNWTMCGHEKITWASCFSDLPEGERHLIWDIRKNQWIYWTDRDWPIYELDSPKTKLHPWSVLSVDDQTWLVYQKSIDSIVHFHAWEWQKYWPDRVRLSLDSINEEAVTLQLYPDQPPFYLYTNFAPNQNLQMFATSCFFLGLFCWVLFSFFGVRRTTKKEGFAALTALIIATIGVHSIWLFQGQWTPKWKDILSGSGFDFAKGEMILWLFILAVFSFLWINTPHVLRWIAPEFRKKLGDFGQSFIYFLTLLSTFYFAVAAIRAAVLHQMSISHASELQQWNIENLFWYASIVIFVTALFVMSYRLQKSILKLDLPLGKKLLSLLGAGVVFLPFFLFFPVDIHPFAFFILAFIIIILMDLFAENVSGGLTWPFIWLTVLAACTSLLVFSFSSLRLQEYQKNLLQSWMENKEMPASENESYFLAKYQGERLVAQSGPRWGVPSMANLNTAEGEIAFFETGQAHYFTSRQGETTYLIGRHKMGFNQPVSLYAFFFVLWVVVALCLLMINRPLQLLPRDWAFFWSALPSLRKRIQFYILAVTVGSFATIALVTYVYFEYQARDQAREIALFVTSTTIQDVRHQWRESPDASPIFLFEKAQKQHQTSGGLYQVDGTRLAGEGSPLLPLRIREADYFKNEDVRIQQGQIYYKLNGPSDEVFIAQFNADTESLQLGPAFRQIILTLLNIYVFLFVLTGGIAVAISNSITAPLKVLSERLKTLKLGKKNVPLEWSQKDELGELIRDYNRMILQLEESAKILATTERETAWREMAKQVAHEIKNPLTPMKLSLQHLQIAIENESPNKEKLFRKVSATLIEQIDNLNRIASEFSSFAKMPEPENKVVSLNEVMASIHDLFRERKDMDIKLFVPIDDLRVFADKDHLLRVMSNLIKNAIQAIPEDRRGKIVLKLTKKGDEAVILVSDNGKGIPDELKEKVFKPNFTSKSSGTGLGLAICANIIEGFNGKIYFETEVNKGTVFYVVIPLMRTKENFYQRERVTL